MGASSAMWGGRFGASPDASFRAINDSIGVDWRLLREDIEGSRAWARALAGAGVLDESEAAQIVEALDAIEAEAPAHAPTDGAAEDVHTWVEQRLIERIGPLGKKLHTGRSRNDQVATDLRLWTRRAIDGLSLLVADVQRALVSLGEREFDTVLPGYTHLQRAQPILAAHWALAYVEMLERDRGRLHDARRRVDACPLGCGALAGTAYAIDREALAKDLGFASICGNSLDAVSDRDFVLETLDALAQMGLHLSRLGEDLVLYASGEFAFVEVGDAFASGSSLMPQKKNPDALELIRGKAGVICGARDGFAMVLKGLALAYNKDLQEDKRALFCAVDEASLCLRLVSGLVPALRFDRARCLAAARGGHANATDLADALVSRGVPFREAHEIVGGLVRQAVARGVALEELDGATLRAACALIDDEMLGGLDIGRVLARRCAAGGTAPARVGEALASWRSRLEKGA